VGGAAGAFSRAFLRLLDKEIELAATAGTRPFKHWAPVFRRDFLNVLHLFF
jgi:hypothetical protein